METKICPICGKEYHSPWRTCSKECGNKAKGEKLRQRAIPLREKRSEERRHRCLTCGKDLFDSRKFCSRSCAAKYNNRTREHKTWTEEQRKKISRERLILHGKDPDNLEPKRCKHCGSIIQVGNCCDICRPYSPLSRTFKKLNIDGITLEDKYKKLKELYSRMYLEEKKSTVEIAAELGLWRHQVDLFLKKAGIGRSLSESIVNAFETGRKGIPTGSRIKYKSGFHTTWEGRKVWLRSSYEFEYAQQLDSQRIPYEVETKRIRYHDTVQQKERIAVPDFYLPDTNELIEVKSTYTLQKQEMKDKFKAYQKLGYIPKLWLNGSYTAL